MEIQINNLSIKYDEQIIIHNYSEHFQAGEHIAIIGTSGIGKTSFINALMGLIHYDGEIILAPNACISAVFQENRLFEGLSVYKNIRMTASNPSAENIGHYITLAGLTPQATVNTLSGGMKRRVAILRAILAPFDILILDEPFKGLDADTKLCMMNLVKEKVSEKTMVLVTHDHSETEFFNSRIIDFSSFDMKQ